MAEGKYEGSTDSLDQGANGIEIDTITFEDGAVTFKLVAISEEIAFPALISWSFTGPVLRQGYEGRAGVGGGQSIHDSCPLVVSKSSILADKPTQR